MLFYLIIRTNKIIKNNKYKFYNTNYKLFLTKDCHFLFTKKTKITLIYDFGFNFH